MKIGDQILLSHKKHKNQSILLTTPGMCHMGLLFSYISTFTKRSSLTLILNFPHKDAIFFKSNFHSNKKNFQIECFQNKVKEKRQKSYSKGGAIFTTSLILLLDLLSGDISSDIINNLFIFKGENCEKNSICFLLDFIRANSHLNSKPTNLFVVLNNLEVVENKIKGIKGLLGVDNMLIWPIYKAEIKNSILEQEFIVDKYEYCVEMDNLRVFLQNNILLVKNFIEKKLSKKFGIEIEEFRKLRLYMIDNENEKLFLDYINIKFMLNKICENNIADIGIIFFSIINNFDIDLINLLGIHMDHVYAMQNKLIDFIFSSKKIPKKVNVKKFNEFFNDEVEFVKKKVVVKLGANLKFVAIDRILDKIEKNFSDFKSETVNVLIYCNSKNKKRKLDNFLKIRKNCDFKNYYIISQLIVLIKAFVIKKNYLKKKEKEIRIILKIFLKFLEILQDNYLVHYKDTDEFFQLAYFEKLFSEENEEELKEEEKIEEICEEILIEDFEIINEKKVQNLNLKKSISSKKKNLEFLEIKKNKKEISFDLSEEKNQNKKRIQKEPLNIFDYKEIVDLVDIYYRDQKIDFKYCFENDFLDKIKKDQTNNDKNIENSFKKSYDEEEKEKLLKEKNNSPEKKNKEKQKKTPTSKTSKNSFFLSPEKTEKKQIITTTHITSKNSTFSEKFEVLTSKKDILIYNDIQKDLQRELKLLNSFFPKKSQKIILPKQAYTLYIKNSYQSDNLLKTIKRESQNFDSILKKLSEMPKSIFTNQKIKNDKGLIIIDKREFNSKLPYFLYKKGFIIKPILLKSSDYILTNKIGVERKDCETGDLVNSLKNGRLLKQLKIMSKVFCKVYLLVENFGKLGVWPYFELFKVLKRCNGVRIIWSKDFKESAEFFCFLRMNSVDPDPIVWRKKLIL